MYSRSSSIWYPFIYTLNINFPRRLGTICTSLRMGAFCSSNYGIATNGSRRVGRERKLRQRTRRFQKRGSRINWFLPLDCYFFWSWRLEYFLLTLWWSSHWVNLPEGLPTRKPYYWMIVGTYSRLASSLAHFKPLIVVVKEEYPAQPSGSKGFTLPGWGVCFFTRALTPGWEAVWNLQQLYR